MNSYWVAHASAQPGVKINVTYYGNVILRQMLLADICAASGSEFFVFQQDSAASHRAKDTVALLDQETPAFYPTRSLAT